MANSNLPHNQGLHVAAQCQATPVPAGAQFNDTIEQYDSNGQLTTVACTYPAFGVTYEVAVPNTAGNYDLKVPFACKVSFVSLVKVGVSANAGDTLTVGKVTLAGAATAITNAIGLNVADKAFVAQGTLDTAANSLEAGATLRVTAAKAADCACVAFVTVLPA